MARTTLRVPARLEPALSRLTREQGLTRNESLVALAERGALTLDAERRAEVAREQREPAVPAPTAAGLLPTSEEVEAAMLESRGGRG